MSESKPLSIDLASLLIALASACITSGFVIPAGNPISCCGKITSQALSQPEGVPLYPIEMIRLSFTIIAPTFNLLAVDNLAKVYAVIM